MKVLGVCKVVHFRVSRAFRRTIQISLVPLSNGFMAPSDDFPVDSQMAPGLVLNGKLIAHYVPG